ncbi:MAG: ATP:cob(I)alamin adenosyltransferase [Clostridia bacterium]|nr:ATP:cob(I)alamin adenosyltransferase [Clostridia bacterium]
MIDRLFDNDGAGVFGFQTFFDELGSFLGLARVNQKGSVADKIEQIQHDIVLVSAHIAGGAAFDYAGVAGNYEVVIDSLTPVVDMPDRIVVSGGNESAAYIDVCRAVTRRCERRAVSFVNKCGFDGSLIVYLNRLSDYLFMLELFVQKTQK